MGKNKYIDYLIIILLALSVKYTFAMAKNHSTQTNNLNNLEEIIRESTDFENFETSCKNINVTKWKTDDDNPPDDTCTTYTLLIASKVFNLDFPFYNCIINIESGDKRKTAFILRSIAEGNFDQKTFYINPFASDPKKGHGYGQLVQNTFDAVIKKLTNSDELKKKFEIFFNLMDLEVDFSTLHNIKLNSMHPLINIAFSLAVLTHVKLDDINSLKSRQIKGKNIFIGGINVPRETFDSGLPNQLRSNAFKYYRNKVYKEDMGAETTGDNSIIIPQHKPTTNNISRKKSAPDETKAYEERENIIKFLAALYKGVNFDKYVKDTIKCVYETEAIYKEIAENNGIIAAPGAKSRIAATDSNDEDKENIGSK